MNEILLFEHESKQLEVAAGSQESMKKLEDGLSKLWRRNKKGGNGFYTKSSDKGQPKNINQQFLEFDYRNNEIKANQYIGVFQDANFRVTVLPKIFHSSEQLRDISDSSEKERDLFLEDVSLRILYMMIYAYHLNPALTNITLLSDNPRESFLELFISIFATKVLAEISRAPFRSYNSKSRSIKFIKGKIVFQENLKRNIWKNQEDKIFCRYDSFQVDNKFNQIIKFVSYVLLHNTHCSDNRRKLMEILDYLEDVKYKIANVEDTFRIRFNKYQQQYIPILNLCRLFLTNSTIAYTDSSLETFSFFLDMNDLFERFIFGFIKDHLSEHFDDITFQKSDKYLANGEDNNPVFRMQQDIYLEDPTESSILDVKYKSTDFNHRKGEITQSDIYQMVAYCIRQKCKRGYLLFPKYAQDNSKMTRSYEVRDSFSQENINIKGVKIDLSSKRYEKELLDEKIKRQLSSIFGL